MKLAYVVNANIPDDWAHSIQIMSMCKAFAQKGEEVILVVPKRKILQGVDPFDHYGMAKTFVVKKVWCLDIIPGNQSIVLYWLRFISFYLSARVFVWMNHFDILYSRDTYSAIFFPNVVLERHSFPKKMSFSQKIFFNLSSKIIVLTSFIKDRLVKFGIEKEKILIAPDGVDMENFRKNVTAKKIENIEQSDFIFGYIGTLKTMGKEKGLSDCLLALKYLNNNFKLLIVGGEKDDIEYYTNMTKHLGLSGRAIFVGKVSHTEIPSYMSLCDVLVAPFPNIEHYAYFMSPLKIFEYMASGKPIVTTNLPSIREVLTDGVNAILIPPNDPKALAEKIVFLKENPDVAKKISQKAYEDVISKYTWGKRAENIISFITK